MGYSKLCRAIVPASEKNYTQGRRGYKICKFTPHHMAGVLTGEQCAKLFQKSGRGASSNYCIGNDGGIVGCVDEDNRAWTSANRTNDCQAITVEVSNSEVGREWPISEAAWNSLIELAVDVCKRYNFRLVHKLLDACLGISTDYALVRSDYIFANRVDCKSLIDFIDFLVEFKFALNIMFLGECEKSTNSSTSTL